MPLSRQLSERLRRVLPRLLEIYPTPFHVYDAGGIVDTFLAMRGAFPVGQFQQYFAVKALPNPAVLRLLVEAGSGLDCSSPVELELAARVGAQGDGIVFTSNNTTEAEYDQALGMGALVTFDDVRYVERAARLPDVVAFRVAPHGGAAGSSLMGGVTESKFGVPTAKLVAAYALARSRGARRFGIHGMTCANELDAERWGRAALDLIATAAMVQRELDIRFEYLNFGGGLGIPYRPTELPLDFAVLASTVEHGLQSAFGERRPRVLMECGRFVSGPHGVLVTRVINRLSKSREIVGLDASMSALMRPGLYREAYHHVSLPFAEPREERVVDVVGSLCESLDRFAVGRTMPDPREGDVALLHDTGAHGHAMGFNYNGRLRPAELMLTRDDQVLEIRRAETFEDYVATVRWQPRVVLGG